MTQYFTRDLRLKTLSVSGTTTFQDLIVNGNTTLGDASDDTLTINAGAWTIGNPYTVTRSAGAAASGTVIDAAWDTTFTADPGGATTFIQQQYRCTLSGGNAAANLISITYIGEHAGSNTVTTIRPVTSTVIISGTGSATNAQSFRAAATLSGTGGSITNLDGLLVNSPTISGTVAVTSCRGVRVTNIGNASFANVISFDATTLTNGATLTASFRSQQDSGTAVWGFLHTGTANNAFNGNTRIGSTTAPTVALDVTGQGKFSQSLATIGGITTSGTFGTPAIVATGRVTGQTAAVASISTFTVGASDGSFEVSANVNVTTATTHSFTVTCTYTDETSTSRTLTLGFTQLSGATLITAITNITGAGPYESPVYHIRCLAGSTITIATTGTFTAVAYNCEGVIKQTN